MCFTVIFQKTLHLFTKHSTKLPTVSAHPIYLASIIDWQEELGSMTHIKVIPLCSPLLLHIACSLPIFHEIVRVLASLMQLLRRPVLSCEFSIALLFGEYLKETYKKHSGSQRYFNTPCLMFIIVDFAILFFFFFQFNFDTEIDRGKYLWIIVLLVG